MIYKEMKRVLKTKLIVLVLLLSFMTSHLSAQNNGIFFQAVARDKFSNPAKDRKIFVQSTIIQSSATGTQALIEEHQTNTDASGVFSISLGNGLRVGGASSNLASIDWPKGPFFLNLKVAITPIGSNSNWEYSKEWIDMGTTNFGAVPFAFYAANAAGLDQKINFSDTTKFLLPYAKKIDVQALATNVDTKLATKFNLTDTIKYSKLAYTDSFFNKKLNIADSANGYVTPTMLAAKSFDQSPITNAIGLKLNITDSVSKYVTPTMLAAKTFDSAAMYNRMSLKANITDLVPLVNSITLNTANISVNTSSITANSSLITTETARARAAELALSNNIASNTASITANATAITTESTTARAAELTLINSVASNTASITSNTSNFVTLNTKVASNTASITANSIAITSESTTARAAELTLTNSVVSNTASITSNTSDIVTLNTNVASNSASIIANTTAITSESTTARAAELTLTNSVVSNTASITSNTSDIVTLNTNVASNTASITANTTAITSESTTARAAELTLTNNVAANTASITANLAVINLKAPIASPTFIGTVTTGTLNTGTLTTGSVTLPTTHGSANQVLSTTGSGTLTWTTPITTLTTSGSGAATLSGTTINIPTASTYTLTTASASILGGIKVGSNLSIDGSGVLSANINAGSISGTVLVANGGTGANTLTGYVKGTGTTAMTASSTIPVADVVGAVPITSATGSDLNLSTSKIVPTNVGSIGFSILGQKISAPSNAAFNFGTSNFTIEGWYNLNNIAPATSWPLWIMENGNAYFMTIMRAGSGLSGQLSLYWNDSPTTGDPWNFQNTANNTFPVSTWTHVCAMRNGDTYSLYMNGKCVASVSGMLAKQMGSSALTFNIGIGGVIMDGSVTNFRVVKGSNVYNYGTSINTTYFTPPTTIGNITGTQLLIAPTSSSINDLSSNAFTITKVGSPTFNNAPTSTPTLTYDAISTSALTFTKDGNLSIPSLSSAGIVTNSASGVLSTTSVVAIANGGTGAASATAALTNLGAASINANLNDQTGTTYTLLSSDNGKVVTLNNAAAITLTVPAGLATGFNCMIVQKGAGLVTITPASTVTVTNRSGGTKTGGQNAIVTIISISSNYFITGGDMQ